MQTCIRCRAEFDLSDAKRIIGRKYGAGTYDEYYPEGNVCEDCAIEEISCDFAAGAETIDLMRTSWEDD